MTVPFENDTSSVVRKLAKRSMKLRNAKTILAILTIMLSAALLSGFILSAIGMETESKRELRASNHVLYYNLGLSQIQNLEQDARISDSRIIKQAPSTRVENYLVIPVYVEQKDSGIAVEEIVEGSYPQKLYDVAVDRAYLKRLGLPDELGVRLTVPFYDGGVETFTVTGLTDSGSTELAYTLYFSKEYSERGSQLQDAMTALAARIAQAERMSKEAFEETVWAIGSDYGIARRYFDMNDGFVSSLQPVSEDAGIIVIFLFVILFVSYLVIYSIFYIDVQNQVRAFGQLRTLGTTSRQIKKLLHIQGKMLCVCGAALGFPMGAAAAFVFKPNGWSWLNTLFSCLLVLALIYGMIWLAIRKPAQMAGSVSPVEAAKSTGYQTGKIVSKKLYRRITPLSLAVMGSSRNRRKQLTTVFSLGVAAWPESCLCREPLCFLL